MATNEELARMINKGFDDVTSRMATKEDLKQFATKEDLKQLETKVDRLETGQNAIKDTR